MHSCTANKDILQSSTLLWLKNAGGGGGNSCGCLYMHDHDLQHTSSMLEWSFKMRMRGFSKCAVWHAYSEDKLVQF